MVGLGILEPHRGIDLPVASSIPQASSCMHACAAAALASIFKVWFNLQQQCHQPCGRASTPHLLMMRHYVILHRDQLFSIVFTDLIVVFHMTHPYRQILCANLWPQRVRNVSKTLFCQQNFFKCGLNWHVLNQWASISVIFASLLSTWSIAQFCMWHPICKCQNDCNHLQAAWRSTTKLTHWHPELDWKSCGGQLLASWFTTETSASSGLRQIPELWQTHCTMPTCPPPPKLPSNQTHRLLQCIDQLCDLKIHLFKFSSHRHLHESTACTTYPQHPTTARCLHLPMHLRMLLDSTLIAIIYFSIVQIGSSSCSSNMLKRCERRCLLHRAGGTFASDDSIHKFFVSDHPVAVVLVLFRSRFNMHMWFLWIRAR